jgi:hypothetical protein
VLDSLLRAEVLAYVGCDVMYWGPEEKEEEEEGRTDSSSWP